MNFEALKHKKIRLFGKSRALEGAEFSKQLQHHEIILADEMDEDVVCVVQGRLVTPVEQDELERIYAEKLAPIIELEALERWLCSSIDADSLLMSLKLSGDRTRLMGYLQNRYIDNALFLRLLKLYSWEGEGFFESDENRDVTAALISRFYENIERNHNVQYANMGIMHLLNQSEHAELLETIALLAPLQQALKTGCDNSTQKILNAIALHPGTSIRVLKQYLKQGNDDIQMLIAMRHDLPLMLQEYLLNLSKPLIDEVLSLNVSIAHKIAVILLEAYPENIAKHIVLDETLFEQLKDNYATALAENSSLDTQMQAALLYCDAEVQKVLARNSHIDDTTFERLFESEEREVVQALIDNEKMDSVRLQQLFTKAPEYYAAEIAGNSNTPVSLLQELSRSSDVEVLLSLAKNPATPIELLYQFQLDSRLARAVKENASFGRHIQRDNIGWDV